MSSSFTRINAKLLLSIMNISFTTFSALSYRLTLLDQHNCHHFLVHIYSDRKSLYNVQINYCLAFRLSSQRFPLLSRRECGGAHDGFVMPVSALIPSLHLFVKPLDLVFESHEYR